MSGPVKLLSNGSSLQAFAFCRILSGSYVEASLICRMPAPGSSSAGQPAMLEVRYAALSCRSPLKWQGTTLSRLSLFKDAVVRGISAAAPMRNGVGEDRHGPIS